MDLFFVYNMLIYSPIIIIFSLLIYYCSNYYISELGISFLPYFLVLNIVFLIILIIKFYRLRTNINFNNKKNPPVLCTTSRHCGTGSPFPKEDKDVE